MDCGRKKIDKLGFCKILKFCSSNHIIKKMKGKDTDWEKIFAKHLYDKEISVKI